MDHVTVTINSVDETGEVGAKIYPWIHWNHKKVFGKEGAKMLAEKLQVPLLGEIPLVQSICEAGDAGRPAVMQENTPQALAFMELGRNVAQQVSIVNATKALSVAG